MITFSVPEKIARGSQLSGKCEVHLDNEVSCREVVIYLECQVQYTNPCTNNFGSGWTQEFRTTSGLSGGRLRHSVFDFNFAVPANAPATYKGKKLTCKWFVKTKIDIPMAFDINQLKEVVVE